MFHRCVWENIWSISSPAFFCVAAGSHCVLLFQGVHVGSSLSASHMENTMKLLRGRVQSRLALHKQFASLGMLFGNSFAPEIWPMMCDRFEFDSLCSRFQSTASSQSPLNLRTSFLPKSSRVWLAGPQLLTRSTW